MSRGSITRSSIVLAAVATLLIAILSGSAAATSTQAVASADAVSTLADCSARTGSLSVVLLVDESASLIRTDPQNRRVDALRTALTGLAQVSERTATTDHPVSVDVSMLGFGVSTNEVVPWTTLDVGHLPDLLTASDQFASLNHEIDTDYAAALLGARDQLAPRVNASCTAILWFTDGQYDIEPRSTSEHKPYAPDIALTGPDSATALEESGKTLLCQQGGVVDGLRAGGTEILAVALSTDISPQDQDFLQAVAEGSAGMSTCGSPRPSGSPPAGAYLGASDLSQVIAGFFKIVNDVAGGTALPGAQGIPVCPINGCESGTHSFEVDPGILSFNLLALTSAPGIDLELRSPEPGTAPLRIAPDAPTGEETLGSATVRWTWVAADAALIDVTLPTESGAWNGQWAVTFIDRTGTAPNAVGNAELYVFGDIEPNLEPMQFRAGEPEELRVAVQHREGTPVNESLFDKVSVEAVVVNPSDGARQQVDLSQPDGDDIRTGSWTAPTPNFPATVNVSVTARVTTMSGQALTPVTRTFPIDVLPPESYPTIQPSDVRFATVTGVKPQEATVTVRGGDTSGGCLWLEESATSQSPQDAGRVVVRPEPAAKDSASCLRVEAGETKELQLIVSPDSSSNGVATGTLTMALISDTNPDLLEATVNFQAPLQKPLDTQKALKLSALLMVLGIALPLALMWLLNWLTAKFEPPSQLKSARIPVTISSSEVIHRKGRPNVGLALDLNDFSAIDGSTRTRQFEVRGVRFTGRTKWSPFAPPFGEAQADGYALGALPPPTTGPGPKATPVPFGLAGTAIVLIPTEVLQDAADPRALIASSNTPATAAGRGLPVTGLAGTEQDMDARRPDLDLELLLFAPSTRVGQYLKHFDLHRDAIAAVVNSLLNRARTQRREEQGASPTSQPTDPAPPRTDPGGGTAGPRGWEGPPGRSGADAPTRSGHQPPRPNPGPPDPLGPPPGRTH